MSVPVGSGRCSTKPTEKPGGRRPGSGESRRVRTACPLDCWDTCAFLVDVSEGRVIGLRGDPDHPVTRGRLCPKARFQLDRHRSPGRLRTPLVRWGERLVNSSWPAALDLVAERLLSARERHGSLSVLHYWDAGSMGYLKNLYHRLFNLFGGVTEPLGSLCLSAGLAAQEADFGRVLCNAPEDLPNTRAVIIWGRNPSDTSPHFVPFIEEARAGGAPVVVIDPLRTATVKDLADRHVAPRPGTDALLALAVAGEILRRGAHDEAFCRERAKGFDEYARAAAGLATARAAEVCDIPEEDILHLAGLLIERRPAAFLMGYGLQRHARGGETVRAIDALAAITGNVGVSGGGANYANMHVAGVLRSLAGKEPASATRGFERPAFGHRVRELADPPVEVLFCERANPLAQLPNLNVVTETWRRIPFKVVAELLPTDTAALADVVLPVADFLEDEDIYYTSWHNHLTWGIPAVEPPEGVWSELRVIAELAERLGCGGEFRRTPAQWLAHALEPLVRSYPDLAPGGDPMALRGTTFPNPTVPAVPWAEGPFPTPSGRFEFGRTWESLAAEPGGGAPGAGGEGEPLFHLISPQHRLSLHSQFYDRALKRTSRETSLPAVFVHPAAAERLGLAGGQVVTVRSAQGELKAQLVLDDGLRQDTICIYSGGTAGHTEAGLPASANLLTPDDLTDVGLQAAYYNCLCRLQ